MCSWRLPSPSMCCFFVHSCGHILIHCWTQANLVFAWPQAWFRSNFILPVLHVLISMCYNASTKLTCSEARIFQVFKTFLIIWKCFWTNTYTSYCNTFSCSSTLLKLLKILASLQLRIINIFLSFSFFSFPPSSCIIGAIIEAETCWSNFPVLLDCSWGM